MTQPNGDIFDNSSRLFADDNKAVRQIKRQLSAI
jgi:hypothetical protein